MTRTRILFVLALAAPVSASAQQGLSLVDRGSEVTITSALKVPLAVMVAPATRSQARSTYAYVAPTSTTTLEKPGTGKYALSKMEPVSWTIMATQEPKCTGNQTARDVAAVAAELRSTLDRLSLQRDIEIEQQAALATQVASIELAQEEDKRNFQRYNAFDMEIRRQYFRDNPYGNAYAEQDFNRDVEDVVNAFASLNKMFAAGDDAKRMAIANEVTYLEPLAKGADDALKTLRQEYERAEAQSKSGSGFMEMVVDKLSDNKPAISTVVSVSGNGRRACAKAAGIEDYVEVRATPEDPRLAIALGEVSFDRGGSHKTLFRRIKGTDRWIASIYWPTEASKSQVKIHNGSGWKKVATLEPGRQAMFDARKQAEKNIENVKKRYKTLKFRAEGGDGVKTMIIP